MSHKWYVLSKSQRQNLINVRERRNISTIAAVDLEALKLVSLKETNDGVEVWLTPRGRAAIQSGRVDVQGM